MSVPPISITGYACCNAIGSNRKQVRASLFEGRTGLRTPRLDLPFETSVGELMMDLPALTSSLRGWTTRTNQIAALLLEQLSQPLERLRSRWNANRIGIILGTSTAGADVTEAAYRQYLRKGSLPQNFDLFKHHTYGSVLHVMRELSGAKGPSWVISTACTSSAKPLASAQRLIIGDMIDAAIVGGIDTLCAMTLKGFHSLEALSSKPCKPFSEKRDGLNIGEGGALLLLERRGDALALLEGTGESSDAYHISAPQPQGLGAKLAMERALEQAGLSSRDIDLINAHGTGTHLNDAAEAQAIFSLFGEETPVVSTKGFTGHMLGAAGGTEAVFAAMAIEEQWTPASLHADPLDPSLAIRVLTERTQGAFRRVMSNGFAFGGNNISLLLGAP